MNHPDDLELAAFAQGNLSTVARQRVLVHLADCSLCAELIAETRRFLEGPADGAVHTLPLAPRRTRRPTWHWLIGAATAAALAWAIPGLWRSGTPVPAGLAAELAGQIDARLPDALADRVWSQQAPGFSFAAPLNSEQADFRWGVASVDLELAAFRHDRRSVEILRAGLESWQDSAPEFRAGQAVLAALGNDEPALWLDRLRRLESQRQQAGDSSTFALGRWVEACRLAALSGDEALLRAILASSPRPRVAAPAAHPVDPSISGALAEIDALTPAGVSAWDLPTLATKLRDLILLH